MEGGHNEDGPGLSARDALSMQIDIAEIKVDSKHTRKNVEDIKADINRFYERFDNHKSNCVDTHTKLETRLDGIENNQSKEEGRRDIKRALVSTGVLVAVGVVVLIIDKLLEVA